tara:strand:- start:687 stop:923 length:237 start_codon:yes stop_codon:yes gene_type:complete
MFELIKKILDYYSFFITTVFFAYIINLFYNLLKEKIISIRKKNEYEYYSNYSNNEKYNKNLVIFNKIIKNNELYYNYF